MNTTIKSNTTITAKSICDADCIFTAEVLERKGNFVTVKVMNEVSRKKISHDMDGNEVVYALGKYSMCPVFR
jgi:hypothetical protein